MGYLCRSGGEAASRSPAAVSRRSGPACNDSAASMRWLCPRVAGYAWDRREFQDRTRPFPASEYRACGIVFPYISANSTAKDLPPTAAKAEVLRTVAFHRCGRMTVRFVRSIRTHQSKRSGRSTAGALRTPSDRSKIRNSRDMRGMDDEPSRRRSCASVDHLSALKGPRERPTPFATPRLVTVVPHRSWSKHSGFGFRLGTYEPGVGTLSERDAR